MAGRHPRSRTDPDSSERRQIVIEASIGHGKSLSTGVSEWRRVALLACPNTVGILVERARSRRRVALLARPPVRSKTLVSTAGRANRATHVRHSFGCYEGVFVRSRCHPAGRPSISVRSHLL